VAAGDIVLAIEARWCARFAARLVIRRFQATQRLARTLGRTENAGLKMAFGLQRPLYSMIPKSGNRFSEKDHAQTKS